MSNNSVNVSFRVSGGEVQSYMDRIQQRATEMSRTMLRNAEQESDVAKNQLRSYQAQLVALERRLRTEQDLAKIGAELNRDRKTSDLRGEMQTRYSQLDQDRDNGTITNRQHRLGVASLDQEEQRRTGDIQDEYQLEMNASREAQRDSALLLRTMRDNVETIRSTSAQELNQMRHGDETLVDAIADDNDPNALLANRLSSQQFIEEQASSQEDPEKKESTFSAITKALQLERIGSMVASAPQATNELDFIKPMTTILSMAAGSLIGLGFEAATVGQIEFTQLGAQFGEKFGEFAGGALERTYRGREELSVSNLRLQALSGRNGGIDQELGTSAGTPDLSKYGMDYKATSELQYNIAAAQGNSSNLGKNVENAVALKQALGIDDGLFTSITELLRSSKSGNRDVMKLIGGVASAGSSNIFAEDRTFLPEFMEKNFTNLQKTFLSTQNNVASGTTFDVLKRFDSIGGPFAARDYRSQGLINTMQGSLTNPGSDNMKALSFIGLRRENPEMGFFDLLKERQKGLASPSYVKSMMSMVEEMGGPEDMQKYNMAGMFGLEGNLDAVDLLYKNRNKLKNGEISATELVGTGQYSEQGIRSKGENQTTIYTKSTAEIQNAFVESATGGIALMSSKMASMFGTMMDDMQIYIKDYIKKTMTNTRDESDRKTNATKAPSQYRGTTYGN